MAAPVRFDRPRERLAELVSRGGERYSDLSRMVRRHEGYLGRFVREGVPSSLPTDVTRLLGAYYRADAREFGPVDEETEMERPDGVAPSSHAGEPRSSAGRAA